MGYSVHFTRQALADQAAITEYLVSNLGNPEAARHFLDELEGAVSALERTPEAFAALEEPRLCALDYRKILFMNYVALFRVESDRVFISHIFHQSQDYARLV